MHSFAPRGLVRDYRPGLCQRCRVGRRSASFFSQPVRVVKTANAVAVILSGKHGQRRLLLRSTSPGSQRLRASFPLDDCRHTPSPPGRVHLFISSAIRTASFPLTPAPSFLPADGRVVVATDEENAGRPGKRISVFLAIWNVACQSLPRCRHNHEHELPPRQIRRRHARIRFHSQRANVITLATDSGEIIFKQIAGLIARRVVCWKKAGDRVARGERIGLVRFRLPRRPLAPPRFRAARKSRRSRKRRLQRRRLLAATRKSTQPRAQRQVPWKKISRRLRNEHKDG